MTALLMALTLLQDIEQSEVKFKSGDDEIKAPLIKPKGGGPFSAVIVIHEWWGINDQIKGVASKLAKEGYVALCVDLYRGRSTGKPEEAHELMRGLPEDRAVRDLKAAFAFLKDHKNVKGKQIGCIGFCMGGGYALSLAVEEVELASCVIFYGRLLTDRDTLAKVKAAVLTCVGDKDLGIPSKAVKEFETTMKDLKKEIEAQIYPGAGHAFMNETQKSYHKTSAEDAWKKTLAHFKRHLSGSAPDPKAVTKVKFRQVADALALFKMDNNKYPEKLKDLVVQPAEAKRWPPGGYVSEVELMRDGWGRDLIYKIKDDGSFELKSLGADGKEGGTGMDEDLVYPTPK